MEIQNETLTEEQVEATAKKSLDTGRDLQHLNSLLEQADVILKAKSAYEQVGIFRLSGNRNTIQAAFNAIMQKPSERTLADHGPQSEALSSDPNNIVGLVKFKLEHLRHTPDDYSDDVKSILREFKQRLDEEPPMLISEVIQQLMDKEALEEAKFFQNMMYISRQVTERQNVNKMTKENVAISIAGPRFQNFIDEVLGDSPDPGTAFQDLQKYQKLIIQDIDTNTLNGNPVFAKRFDSAHPEANQALRLSQAKSYLSRKKEPKLMTAEDLKDLLERSKSLVQSIPKFLSKISPLKFFNKKSKKKQDKDKMSIPPELLAAREQQRSRPSKEQSDQQHTEPEKMVRPPNQIGNVARFCRELLEMRDIANQLRGISQLSDDEYYFDTISRQEVIDELKNIENNIEKVKYAGSNHYLQFLEKKRIIQEIINSKDYEGSSLTLEELEAELEEIDDILSMYQNVGIDKVANQFKKQSAAKEEPQIPSRIQKDEHQAMRAAFSEAQSKWQKRIEQNPDQPSSTDDRKHKNAGRIQKPNK